MKSIELSVFNETYELEKNKIKMDFYLAILVKVDNDDYTAGLRIIGQEFQDITQARIRYLKEIEITLMPSLLIDSNLEHTIKKLKSLFDGDLKNQGVSVILKITTKEIDCKIKPSDKWKINPCDKNLEEFKSFFGNNAIKLNYK